MARNYRNGNKRPSRSYSKKSGGFGGGKWVILGIFIGLAAAVAYWHYQSPPGEKLLRQQPNHRTITQQSQPLKKSAAVITSAPTGPAATPASTQPAPEFDFYTVLPKMQVPANNVQGQAPTPPPAMRPSNPAMQTTSTPTANVPKTTPTQVTIPPSTAPTASAAATTPPSSVKPIAPLEAQTLPALVATPSSQAAGQRYVLQVASVQNYGDADRLKAQLTMLGFEVSIQKYQMNGQTWNRVYVGSYNSREAALKQQTALKQNNISSILIKQP